MYAFVCDINSRASLLQAGSGKQLNGVAGHFCANFRVRPVRLVVRANVGIIGANHARYRPFIGLLTYRPRNVRANARNAAVVASILMTASQECRNINAEARSLSFCPILAELCITCEAFINYNKDYMERERENFFCFINVKFISRSFVEKDTLHLFT